LEGRRLEKAGETGRGSSVVHSLPLIVELIYQSSMRKTGNMSIWPWRERRDGKRKWVWGKPWCAKH
jgi:hypothetical protein